MTASKFPWVTFFLSIALVALVVAIALGIDAMDLTDAVDEQCNRAENDNYTVYEIALIAFVKVGCAARVYSPVLAPLGVVATAFFTGTLWYSTRKLWVTSRDAITVTKDENRDISRAYVHLKSVRFIEDGDTIKWTFFVENSGETPCRRFELAALVQTAEPGGDLKQPDDSALIFKGWSALPRREVHSVKHEPGYETDVKSALKRDVTKVQIFVSGTIKYETVFGESYRTEFSFFSRRKGKYEDTDIGNSTRDGTRMSRTTRRLSVFEKTD